MGPEARTMVVMIRAYSTGIVETSVGQHCKFTVLQLHLSRGHRTRSYHGSHFTVEETEFYRGDDHSLGVPGGETGISP